MCILLYIYFRHRNFLLFFNRAVATVAVCDAVATTSTNAPPTFLHLFALFLSLSLYFNSLSCRRFPSYTSFSLYVQCDVASISVWFHSHSLLLGLSLTCESTTLCMYYDVCVMCSIDLCFAKLLVLYSLLLFVLYDAFLTSFSYYYYHCLIQKKCVN